MPSFKLTVFKERSVLALFEEGSVVAEKNWPESRDMGRQLFLAIHELLSGHDLKPVDITNFLVETEVSDNFTSVKIAQTVAQVYTWAVSFESSLKNK